VAKADAEALARKQLATVNGVEGTTLVVYALDGAAKLAWETTLTGTGAAGYSRSRSTSTRRPASCCAPGARHARHRYGNWNGRHR
jgi:hypothetical protein